MAKTKTVKKEISSSQVMIAVASSIDFIKSQIGNDLLTAKNRGMIDISNDQLKKIATVVESSISQSFYKSSGQIESKLQ